MEKILPIPVWVFFVLFVLAFTFVGMVNGIGNIANTIIEGSCFLDTFQDRMVTFIKNAQVPLTGKDESVLALIQSPRGFDKVADLVDTVNQCSNPIKKTDTTCRTGPPNSKVSADKEKYNLAIAIHDLNLYATQLSVQANAGSQEAQDADTSAGPYVGKSSVQINACQKSWSEIVTQSKSAVDSTEAAAKDFDDEMTKLVKNIKEDILGPQRDDIEKTIQDASDSVGELEDAINDNIEPLKEQAINIAKIVKENRSNFMFGAFGWVFLSLFFAIIGFVMMKICIEEQEMEEPPAYSPEMPVQVWKLKCAGACGSRFVACCGWFMFMMICILLAIVGGLLLTVGTVGEDLCSVVPTLPQSLANNIGGTPKDTIDGCWEGKSLLDVLNISGAVTSQLDNVKFDDFDEQFGKTVKTDGLVDVLDTYEDTIEPLCPGPTNFKSKDYKEAVQLVIDQTHVVNNLIGNYYYNCPIANPYKKGAKCTDQGSKNDNNLVNQLQNSVKGIINQIKDIINGPLTDALRCKWLKTTWDEISKILCSGSGLIKGIGFTGMGAFALAVLAIPYGITLIFINKRYGGHGPLARDDSEIPTAKAEEVEATEKHNPLDFA